MNNARDWIARRLIRPSNSLMILAGMLLFLGLAVVDSSDLIMGGLCLFVGSLMIRRADD
ncbi:hypothetical protein [Paludisphaera sp.]|uniref:hypothetical protein n=1 Tax=Paludisphaera sp. TaxID=2017432 RepID=UPI00301CE9EA